MLKLAYCFLWLTSLIVKILSEKDVCLKDQAAFDEIIQSKRAVDVFYFTNDTKKNIQLTWAVENSGVIILVTMTESDSGPGLTSDIYRSENNGKSFQKITDELGERVYIRREHGLQRQQNQKELFLICYDITDTSGSIIFVTRDGGLTWTKSKVPFILSGQLVFHPRQQLSALILTLEEKSRRLFLSTNSGKDWIHVHDNVVDFFWSIYGSDPESTFYVLYNPDINQNVTVNQTLLKTTTLGQTWTHVMNNVVRVWAPRGIHTRTTRSHPTYGTLNTDGTLDSKLTDRFLYVSHIIDSDNQTQHLSVSLDGGKTFKPVYLPSIQSERFYSVLEVEDDLAFVHVDAPNDTGYGTLYTSDSSGQILTESLRHHLYPNHAPVTDFYRVASMRGTYLTTRMNPNRTLYTVISHDRGASWRPLGVPLNVEGACKSDFQTGANSTKQDVSNSSTRHTAHINSTVNNEAWDDWSAVDYPASKVCGLQISSQFSIRNRVVASAPLSIPAAPGLILAHGHVATHLKNTPADVFVSTDGGYTWNKTLDGPHYCQIANRGGLLVAVPADTMWPDVLRFSTDEGRCWHTIPLRSGVYHADNNGNLIKSTTVTVQVQNSSTTVPPPGISTPSPAPTLEISEEPAPWNETVVFAGLVTEPGGRAMTAAVYGYGTLSQHWRVAIVDFLTNGMVTRNCTPNDYETWVPHSSTEGSLEGCLLGTKQYFKRLKKGALCINNYGMDPLLHSEICPCTQADFECEFGFYRKLGTLECIRNPHVPPFDPCQLPATERQSAPFLTYRRIPGDVCAGGWQPPVENITTAQRILSCPGSVMATTKEESGSSGSMLWMSVLTVAVIIVVVGFFCYRRIQRHSHTSRGPSTRPLTQNGLQAMMFPWKFKKFTGNGSHLSNSLDSQWPPVVQTDRWHFNQMDVAADSTVTKDFRPNLPTILIPHRSHMRPSFIERFRNKDPDVTGLIEAEEVALPNEPSEHPSGLFEDELFQDPLAPPKVVSTR